MMINTCDEVVIPVYWLWQKRVPPSHNLNIERQGMLHVLLIQYFNGGGTHFKDSIRV